MAKSYKTSVPLSLDRHHIDFIERVGVGKNFSDKARDIFRRAEEKFDVIAEYDGISARALNKETLLVYEQTIDGERTWADLPFSFIKKDGWKKLPMVAEKHGYICQVVEDKNTGYIAIFLSLPKERINCERCRAKVLEVMGNV